MTIQEAIKKRLDRVRLPWWTSNAYLEFQRTPAGVYGPWVKIIEPIAPEGNDVPLATLIHEDCADWEAVT